MLLLIGAFTIGLILSLLAFGVFISFRIFSFPDITAEGSITLGGAVAGGADRRAACIPLLATGAAFVAGALAGATTGVLHTRFKINGLLAGILVMTALYSINLHVMGKSNLPLLSERTLGVDGRVARRCACSARRASTSFGLGGGDARRRRCSSLALVVAAIVGSVLYCSSCGPTSAPPCRPPATTRR